MNNVIQKTNSKTFGNLFDPKKIQVYVRKVSSFMVGMIMPVIGVIIAWGIITSLFVSPESPTYNKDMAMIIGPGIRYIIPSLIGYFAGYQVYKVRGGLIGVLATLGCIIGSETDYYNNIAQIPVIEGKELGKPIMFLGAMIAAPIAAAIFKFLEKLWRNHIPQGFEMLVNNFALGILGCVLCLISFWTVTALVAGIQNFFYISINALRKANLIVLMPIFFEPARLLFLNNALDYGIFTPLAISDFATYGKSMFYLFIPNPGPGLGILLAYYFFSGNKQYKAQTAAAMPIHFIGGIHEVYFPFAWIKPISLPFLILADMFNIWTYETFNVGSISNNSPGSVISVYSFLYKSAPDYIGLTISVFGCALLVCLTFGAYLLFARFKNGERIFWNPKFALLNAKFLKLSKNSLFELNAKNKFATLEYQEIELNKDVLVETVIYENNESEKFLLSPKSNKVVSFKYVTKKNWLKKPVVYIVKKYENKFSKLIEIKNKIFNTLTGFKNIDQYSVASRLYTKKIKAINYHDQKLKKQIAHITYLPFKNKKAKTITLKPKKVELAFDYKPQTIQELNQLLEVQETLNETFDNELKTVSKIMFACEAGMGSSAMGASIVRRLLKDNGIENIVVENCPIKDLADEQEVVVTQEMFIKQAKTKTKAYVYPIKQFLDKKEYADLIKKIKKANLQK